jgi:hypothetical protein
MIDKIRNRQIIICLVVIIIILIALSLIYLYMISPCIPSTTSVIPEEINRNKIIFGGIFVVILMISLTIVCRKLCKKFGW